MIVRTGTRRAGESLWCINTSMNVSVRREEALALRVMALRVSTALHPAAAAAAAPFDSTAIAPIGATSRLSLRPLRGRCRRHGFHSDDTVLQEVETLRGPGRCRRGRRLVRVLRMLHRGLPWLLRGSHMPTRGLHLLRSRHERVLLRQHLLSVLRVLGVLRALRLLRPSRLLQPALKDALLLLWLR